MKVLCTSLFALGLTASAFCQQSFESITSSILSNNLSLAAISCSNIEADKSAASDNNLADPEVEFQHLWGSPGAGNKWTLSVSQSFDWPGAYRARSRANKARSNARRQLFVSQQQDLKVQVQEILLQIIGLKQQMALSDEILKNVNDQLTITRQQLSHGEATVIDEAKLRFELIGLEAKHDELSQQLQALHQELIALNNGKFIDITSLEEYPLCPLYDEETYVMSFENNDPFAAALIANAEAARAEGTVSRMGWYPGFSISYDHETEPGARFNGFTVGMSLPLWGNRNKSAASEAALSAAALEFDAYLLQRRGAIRADVAAAKAMRNRLDKYLSSFESIDYMGMLDTLRNSGQLTVLNYVCEVQYYLGLRSEYLELLNNYHLTLARLNRYNSAE